MTKERTDGSPQLNLRVPLEHHERVRRVVALLRTAEAFPARLDELLSTASEPLTPSFQTETMERLARLEAAVFTPTGIVQPTPARAARKAIMPPTVIDSGDSVVRKSGVPLSEETKAKVRHLIETEPEMSNGAIAKAVGVSKPTVGRIRRGRR